MQTIHVLFSDNSICLRHWRGPVPHQLQDITFHTLHSPQPACIGSWPSDHYFRSVCLSVCLLWSPYVIRQTITFLPCDFYLSIYRLPYFYIWRGLSANLECRSETCCMRLAANTGRKKVAKNRHFGTIAQLCRAISSQLRHVSTIGKKTC